MMRPFFLYLFTILSFQLHSEETAWEKMLKLYSSSTSYSMEFKVLMNVKGESQAVTYSGSIRRSGTNYYSSVQGMVTVYGPKYLIMIKEKEKVIYYSRNNQKISNDFTMDQKQFADSLLRKAVKPVLKSKNNVEEVYSYTMKEGVYSSVDYHISVATGCLNKVVYNYRQVEDVSYQQVTITYTSVSVNQPVADSWFAEKNYMSLKGKKPVGAGRFIGYSVIELQTLIPGE